MTEKEFDILLELSGLMIDEGEREAMIEEIESILGYVSQLPEEKGEWREGNGAEARTVNQEPRTAGELRSDETDSTDQTEISAVRKAFPAITRDGLLEVQDVFGSKDV